LPSWAARSAASAPPAPVTPYGLAFDRADRFLFVGSNELGTIDRHDLSTGQIDRTWQGPRYLHRIFASPSGAEMIVLARGNQLVSPAPRLGRAGSGGAPWCRPWLRPFAPFTESTVLETSDASKLLMAAPPTGNMHSPRIFHIARLTP